ncbi:C2H2-type zinc finger transcription factor [Phycomyces blakesleeanus]|uniref:C2H2-type zinc finger transcription factor n=2 Tax=Phycomyces blakesleeanus TaxID=4837 RepID=A0A167LJH4_PHYB8|nr:C2H2-type zinc finger transcription factor [Phycomyces blakesleeanus NRRL 1555(-)]OAD70596.1 C2H2-type zinc finger transcription factor [Phycomyces blakesleeanus NRRL 1555(-)]|eukprot:XP_018288636.1 C2H2-type zinc finger transcription factor [Phycomyces blakesleeanus NRRL 1555(-)]
MTPAYPSLYCPPSKPNHLESLWPIQYDPSIHKDLYCYPIPPTFTSNLPSSSSSSSLSSPSPSSSSSNILSPKICFPNQCSPYRCPQSFYTPHTPATQDMMSTPDAMVSCCESDSAQLGRINYPYYMSTTPTLDYDPSGDNVLQDDNFSIATAPELDIFPQAHTFGARRYHSMPDISLAQTPQDIWASPQSSFSTKSTDDSQHLFISLYAPSQPTTNQDARLPNPNEKRHICPVCFHRSRRRHNLLEHMQTHNPNRPRSFICPSCHRGFARKYDMKRHEKIHLR